MGGLNVQAVILAAGSGTRLVTGDPQLPKCMVSVQGVSLIRQAIQRLAQAGVERVVIVLGYEARQIISHLSETDPEIPVVYVYNPYFAMSNNIISVLRAEPLMTVQDTILVEADVLFTQSLVDEVLTDRRANLAVVDGFHSSMDGGAVEVDAGDCVVGFHDKTAAFANQPRARYFKTVNIYKFSQDFIESSFMPALKGYLAEDPSHENHFYEQALDKVVHDRAAPLEAFHVHDARWYEIDDAEDLSAATTLFTESAERRQDLTVRGGGYWRFPSFVDLSIPALPEWPDPLLLNEIRWGVREAVAVRPSSAATQDVLAAQVLRVDRACAAIVPSCEAKGLAELRWVIPDDLRASGASRLSEVVAALGLSTSLLVPISDIYGLNGLDLHVVVSDDEALLSAARALGRAFDSVSEYALRAAGKLEKRLFSKVLALLDARDALRIAIEETAEIVVSRVEGYGMWCSLPGGGSAMALATRLLSDYDVFVPVDEDTSTFRLSPWSIQKASLRTSDLIDAIHRSSGEA